mmetsp:Transcript_30592/g.40419  ORF Transcript_30592/g.40419 Transcript_30592/m.40419 type:complete len:103 (-) Transcript_30592:2075-2383(-)
MSPNNKVKGSGNECMVPFQKHNKYVLYNLRFDERTVSQKDYDFAFFLRPLCCHPDLKVYTCCSPQGIQMCKPQYQHTHISDGLPLQKEQWHDWQVALLNAIL